MKYIQMYKDDVWSSNNHKVITEKNAVFAKDASTCKSKENIFYSTKNIQMTCSWNLWSIYHLLLFNISFQVWKCRPSIIVTCVSRKVCLYSSQIWISHIILHKFNLYFRSLRLFVIFFRKLCDVIEKKYNYLKEKKKL